MKNNKHEDKQNKKHFPETPRMVPQDGLPEDCNEMVNFFGTYNIQQTDNSGNTYPAIGQGLAEKEAKKLEKEYDRWIKDGRPDNN